jgi:hypothetical protein
LPAKNEKLAIPNPGLEKVVQFCLTFPSGDFDGDRVAYGLARDFPILAAEVKEKNLPQNRYADVIKKDKIPYSGS